MSLVSLLGGVGLCAVLFALFGLWRPSKSCTGDCGGCTGACPTEGGKS
jgi:hypothetical protein